MNLVREYVAPYLLWIKGAAVVIAAVLVFHAGTTVQQNRDGTLMARKDAALGSAAIALRGAAAALREINVEAARRIKAAEDEAKAAAEAGKVAQAAKAKAEKESERFAAEVDRAKARKPGCADLLKQSLEASCGLSPR